VGALAAIIVAIAVMLPASTNRPLYVRKLAIALIVGAIALTMPHLVTALIRGHMTFENVAAAFAAFDPTNVQADRMESLRGGLAMWAAHPIFGAGLGAYIHEHIASTGIPLVIHNSPIWIAAEMGVVGLCAFGLLFGRIGNALRTEQLWAGPDSQAVALASIAALIVMSLAHDLMYQRLLWLILGAATASPLAARAQIKRLVSPLPRHAGEAQERLHRFGFSNPNSSNRE
jgi:O-antigen ligase